MQLPRVDVDPQTSKRIEIRALRALSGESWWERVFMPTAVSLLAAAQVAFAAAIVF